MNEKSSKRREWVKTAAIVFLSVLLVLTFFSQTIMNHSLPEVATKFAQSGSITSKIRGGGTVESADPNVVEVSRAFADRKITKVAVKTGDKVKKGDVLFTLAEGDGSELKEKRAALAEAQDAYDSAVKALNKMQSDFEDYKLENISAEDSANLANYRTKLSQLQVTLNAEKEKKKPLEEQIASLDQAIQDCQKQSAYENEQNSYASARVATAQTALTQAQDKVTAAEAEVTSAQTARDDVQKESEALEEAYANDPDSVADIEASRADVAARLAAAEKTLTDNKTALAAANTALANAQKELDAANEGLAARDVSPVSNNIAKLIAEYDIQRYGLNKQKEAIEKNIANLESQIEKLIQKNDDIQAKQDEISEKKKSVAKQKETIDELKKQIEELSDETSGGEIKAEISGTIISINSDLISGKKLREEVCYNAMTIQPEGQGFYMTMSVTNEQARLVAVGDKATLVNSWYYNDFDITLQSIKPDRTDPAKKKMLTFGIEGEAVAGQSLNISIGQKSQNYDCIVPKSALRNDTNGDYVLIVESKSTPLGNRYIATRVDVQILAEDDTQAAISGAINSWGDYVITTASAPIKAGDQVRMTEN